MPVIPERILVPFLIVLSGIAVVIASGGIAVLSRSAKWRVWGEIISRVAGGTVVPFLFYWLAPYLKREYVRRELNLPEHTKMVLAAADFTVRYWYILLLPVVGLLVVDGVLFERFQRDDHTTWKATLLSLCGTTLILTLLVGTVVSLLRPL